MTTTLITPTYTALNKQLHRERPDYGSYGHRHIESVSGLVRVFEIRSLLDYGCGKGTLLEKLRLPFARGYDPAIPGMNLDPKPAELVVCTDVLEHVEPDCLEAVLEHLAALTQRVLFVNIALTPAKKSLPDGRNAHLSLHTANWWLRKCLQWWQIDCCRATDSEFEAVFRVEGEAARDMRVTNNVRK